jgi:hypothetical protein
MRCGNRRGPLTTGSMPQRRRPPTERERIREVFLGGRASYGAAEVPALLGINEARVRQAIDQGGIAAIADGAETRIAWEDVVTLGLEHRWTVRMITAALRGLDHASLPDLVRVRPGQVVLPRYQWQVLRLLAARRAKAEKRKITVSDLLEEAVSMALLSRIEEWDRLEASLPGVRAAAAWPSAG